MKIFAIFARFKPVVLKISNELKVGALTAVSIALLIIGFNLLKGRNFFSRNMDLYAVYANVDGLAPANPVKVNGLTVGTVSSLGVLSGQQGKILVQLSIRPGIQVPSNSVATIVSVDLLGSKAVELDFGSASTYLHDDDTIRSAIGSSLSTQVLNQVRPLSAKLLVSLESLDSVLRDLHTAFNPATRESLQKSMASLQVMLDHAAKASGGLQVTMDNLKEVTETLRKNTDKITAILANTDTITASLASSDLKGTIVQLDQSMRKLNSILQKVDQGQGSLGLLVNDKHLYEHLNAVSRNLDLLMEDLRLNPQRYVHFSVFGKKSKTVPLPADTLNP